MDDRIELAARLAEVTRQMLAEPETELTLARLVAGAREVIPGADMVGLTLRANKHLETPAASEPLVAECDQLQFSLGEGPCLQAVWQDDVLVSNDLTRDDRWPAWGPQASDRGVRSLLAVRLSAEEADLVGALTAYSRSRGAFDSDSVDVATVYSSLAAAALATTREVSGLQTALQTRHVIGVAQGILMQRYQLSMDRAFDLLRRYSSHTNVKLRDIAAAVVQLGDVPGHPSHEDVVPDGMPARARGRATES